MKRPSMNKTFALATVVVATAALFGCASMAEPDPGLQRAHANFRTLQANPQSQQFAPGEMAQADEALRTADAAWARRDSKSLDHLVYLAAGRVDIARETVDVKTWQLAATTSTAGAVGDKARSDVAEARRDTRAKSAELAAATADARQATAGAKQDKAYASELEAQLKELHAKQTERGEVVTMSDVLFDTNRAELRSGGNMNALVAFLQRHPQRNAMIEGFTDDQGSDAANVALSQRRASAVRDALVAQGVTTGRLSVRGYGEAFPAASNETVAGRQMNRRVEIVLSGEDGIVKAR